ncbi:protein RecF [Stutzerimonas stutzeri]|uniref:AAA family ATPase n=1 Tax=Stutzerimonas stutzeri subgroup TaxID=578833 RepID=UPI000C6E0FBD|nr:MULTISPECIES: ATP-binding protein [Stutzerimonas stutzeri subgroup]MCQ2049361.1 ATP-binding protein [Stutzerimonas kunmingensis]PKR25529.1 chromosome segregation protein SMC [Stutzerimonas stutzeri]QQC10761.1 AAA family ATPase [Stutzerimonas stutzeri]VEI31867.1 protein RecF [Stutzerimonas stutzeri]
MIKKLTIKNYKTIDKLSLDLGRVTVLIGENGAGKSNILEAIALAGAACSNKLDNEFLKARGIRVSDEPNLMRSALQASNDEPEPIEVVLESQNDCRAKFLISHDNVPYPEWKSKISYDGKQSSPDLVDLLNDMFYGGDLDSTTKREAALSLKKLFNKMGEMAKSDNPQGEWEKYLHGEFLKELKEGHPLYDHVASNSDRMNEIAAPLSKFIIYSPENSSLRSTEKTSAIEPLGNKGEGLLKLLYVISKIEKREILETIKNNLKLLGWFSDFSVNLETSGYGLEIKDRHLEECNLSFDQNAANEGFMFLLFYFSLFSTPITPTFFAVDNIDTSLNPKLCQRLIQQLVKLAKSANKQVILTTHNPAILDGLNLDDEEQRLFTISRGRNGQTKASRIMKPKELSGAPELRLSEMFLRGLFGGLPKGF